MSKGLSYEYTGTKGHIVDVAHNLPGNPNTLLGDGWNEISHPSAAAAGTRIFEESESGLRMSFDQGTPGLPGFRGVDHYHIHNPDATSNLDRYLDINGNPVARGSRASHILPKGVK